VLSWFRQAGVRAIGEVAVGDPLAAMERAMRSHIIDAIIVSTLPSPVSRWLRTDLVRRAEHRFDVPVTVIHASAEYDMVGDVAGAEEYYFGSIESSPRRTRAVVVEELYNFIELVGTSTESWEKAAAAAVTKASESLRDLRVAEVTELDLVIEDGVVRAYRAKVKVSFKHDAGPV